MHYDSVTGLPTKEVFIDFANNMWFHSKSDHFAILSVNIGDFRTLNQHYGYKNGDTFLSLFSQRVIRSNPYILSACREKADLFLLFLDINEIHFSHVYQYIYNIFSEFCAYSSELYPNVHLSFEVGVCILSTGIQTLNEAINYALHARKTSGSVKPNLSDVTISFYHDSLLGKNNYECRILPLFEDIMTMNHLILYLQPKFDLATQTPIGAEALVRIMDHDGYLFKPEKFLPVLEKYNLSHELDLLVIESILKLITHWHHIGIEPLPISINLSDKDFSSNEFLQIFDELTKKYPAIINKLEFEISEHSILNNPDYMLQAIQTLHDAGCKVNLDDFGKDSLSINTLGIVPVDTVKFDRCVLSTSMRNPQNIYVLKKLAEMFEDCQIPVICKGIENKHEEDFIKKCGIHYVQGYYYGRPVPIDLFEKKYMIYEFNYA